MGDFGKYLSVALLAFSLLPAAAQEKPVATGKGWFAGVQGGMPFSTADFSSFGEDDVHPGVTGGIYGGYRFNEVLSLEANLKWGATSLSERTCCANEHYWLGADHIRYHAPVIGMDGWDYGNLESTVFMQSYGLQLNVNVPGFFKGSKDSRWTLEISPLLSAVGTNADIHDKADGSVAISGKNRWHLGAGGLLQAGCQVTGLLNIGIFTGMTYLTGRPIDEIPAGIHSSNYIWESGIRIGFKL